MRWIMALTLFVLLSLPTFQPAALAQGPRNGSPRSLAEGILKGITEGIAQGDYNLYSSRFSSTMKSAQNRTKFLQFKTNVQKSLGSLQFVEYLGSYEQQGNFITLFKARFNKEKDDVLIKLVLDRATPDARVTGLWFEAPSLER
ncbi:MAG: hypothetical protein ACOYXY_13015 [Thermodesulfobacteriota bacterium]